MRKRAILCREEHCAVAAEMSLLYEALPSIECKEEEEEGGLSEKGGPTKASDVVGEGGRACLLSPPSLLPSRCCQLQSLSRFLPSLRATICPFLFPPLLPSFLSGVWTCRWDCGLGEWDRGGTKRSPSSPNERNVGRGRDGRAHGRGRGRMAESELGRGKSKLSHFKRWEWRENKNRMGRPQRGGEDKTRMTVQEPRSCRLCKMVGRNELFSP